MNTKTAHILIVNFLCVIILTSFVVPFPNGAPCEVKDLLLPNPGAHGPNRNSAKSAPYEITILDQDNKPATCISKDAKYIVKVKPTGKEQIKGFVLQGVDKQNKPIGKFEENDDLYKYLCPGEKETITHRKAKDMSSLEAQWSPGDTFDGNVHIRATVVEEVSNYYTGITSKSLSLCQKKKTN